MKVDYIDHLGSDLMVVNAARVSFDKESAYVLSAEETKLFTLNQGDTSPTYLKLSEADTKLIKYLATGYTTGDWDALVDSLMASTIRVLPDRDEVIDIINSIRNQPEHWSPFAHPQVSIRVKAPIFVARQLAKHQVGFAWNEVSRRYVDAPPEFYEPTTWRARAENVKQGSGVNLVSVHEDCDRYMMRVVQQANAGYHSLMQAGVCPEQARMVLPQSMYTEWIWTGSLLGWSRVCKLRLDSHTQKETRQVAQMIEDIVKPLFPVSWEALK